MLIAASHWFGERPRARAPGLRSVGSSLPSGTLARIKAHREAAKHAGKLQH
jgi:hypothetical protein